jgi:XTP/dITP diphosphohydrolase
VIFATGNDHKVLEAKGILSKSKFHFESLKDIGFTDDIIEDGPTLEANALIKARHIYNIYQKDVFSEDTGLEVAALNMAPGVITARYAGPQKNHTDNINLTLKNLNGKKDRSAQFRAVIALIYRNKEYLFEGVVRGRIATEPYGKGGFGYDPIFIPEGYDKTFAELGTEIKSILSHRFRAIQKMTNHLNRLKVKV